MSWHPRRRRGEYGTYWFWYWGPLEANLWPHGPGAPLRFDLVCGPVSVEVGRWFVHLGCDL
jgi:hypothetical protein